MRDTLLM